MIRGTTPTHVYTIPFDVVLIDKLKITYAQNGKAVLTKEKNDCRLEGRTITTKLSQEDSLKFKEGLVQIQIRVLTQGGEALASNVKTVTVADILEDGELV